ncbi:hypothetical protein H0X06_03195 [Candidatus Dependentiae bacterium]|nr:hypothetical protein [Candidatus Dependentiae bacterium]
MKRKIHQTNYFSKALTSLLKKRQLLKEDFDDFQEELANNQEMGDRV